MIFNSWTPWCARKSSCNTFGHKHEEAQKQTWRHRNSRKHTFKFSLIYITLFLLPRISKCFPQTIINSKTKSRKSNHNVWLVQPTITWLHCRTDLKCLQGWILLLVCINQTNTSSGSVEPRIQNGLHAFRKSYMNSYLKIIIIKLRLEDHLFTTKLTSFSSSTTVSSIGDNSGHVRMI